MAISLRATGTWAELTADGSVTIPGSPAAGDRMYLWVAYKQQDVALSVSGWTSDQDSADGTAASGNGSGSMRWRVFHRDWQSGDSNPTLDFTGTPLLAQAVIQVWQKASTEAWDTPVARAGAWASSSSQTVSASSTASLLGGPVVMAGIAIADDSATFTRGATTGIDVASGLSWDTNYVESPATHASTTTGNDMSCDLGHRFVQPVGSSPQTLRVTATLSAAETGHVVWIVQNVSQVVTLGLLDASRALYAPSVTFPTKSLTLPLLQGGTTYQETVLADSPVNYWRLGEASGAADDIGSGNADGTWTGTPTYGVTGALSGDSNTAVTLTGSQQIGASPSMGTTGTAEFWAKRTRTGVDEVIIGGPATGVLVRFSADNKIWLAKEDTAFIVSSTSTITDTNWHHFVVAWDGAGSGKVYVDGSDVTGVFGSSSPTAQSTLTIGAKYNGTARFQGSLDEIALYSSVLSAARVTAHYNAATSPATTPILYAPTIVQGPAAITLGLLDAANALYAPTLAVGPVGVTLGLLDASRALYAPTVMPAQFVTLGLLDASNAVYAPTLTATAATITLGLLDAGNALYTPTLLQAQFITLGLLDASRALYAPTLAPQAIGITIPLLDASRALYAPTIMPSQSISIAVLDSGPTLYAPSVVLVGGVTQSLTLPTIYTGAFDPAYFDPAYFDVAGPVLYAPTVTTTAVITLPLLDSGPTLYSPTVIPGAIGVTLGLIDAARAVYAPSLATTNALTLTLLDSARALYAPTVIPDQFVTLGLLDAANALYAPTVYQDQFVTLGLLDSGPTLYSLSLSVGPVTVVVPVLDGNRALYAPSLAPGLFITLDLLDSGPALYAPMVAIQPNMSLPLLDAGRALYAPDLIVDQFVMLGVLDGGATLYALSLSPGPVVVTVPLIDATRALYAPTIAAGAIGVTVPLLDAARALYAPSLAVGAVTVTTPLLDSGRALYAPTFNAAAGVTLPVLESTPTLYAPDFLQVTIFDLPLLDSARALYAPDLSYTQLMALPVLDAARALYAPLIALAIPTLPKHATVLGIVIPARDVTTQITPSYVVVEVS